MIILNYRLREERLLSAKSAQNYFKVQKQNHQYGINSVVPALFHPDIPVSTEYHFFSEIQEPINQQNIHIPFPRVNISIFTVTTLNNPTNSNQEDKIDFLKKEYQIIFQ